MFVHSIDLKTAEKIADAAMAKGIELEFQPLTVAVLDDGGTLKVLKRADGASLLRPEVAIGKAWGSLGFGTGNRVIVGRAEATPMFIDALIAASGGRMVPSPGGVLIKDKTGRIIGAVGITGDTGDNDEICAVAGVEAAGLTPDTGA